MSRTRPFRWRRLLWLSLSVALGVQVAYLVAAGVLLRTGLGIIYAPLLETAARRGTDGTTLDQVVVGSSAEALKRGGVSTLDHLPSTLPSAAQGDASAARGKVVAVTGRIASLQAEGSYFVGMLSSDVGPVYFVTPFVVDVGLDALTSFRGVFVQWYGSPDLGPSQPPALVLVGAFATSMPGHARLDE